jgi:hypothetical protein
MVSGCSLRGAKSSQYIQCGRYWKGRRDPSSDLTGRRFGKWLVLGPKEKNASRTPDKIVNLWLCRCDCGTEKMVSRGNLVRKYSTQCKKCADKRLCKPKVHRTWVDLKRKKLLCPQWLDFETFRAAVGEPPDEEALLRKIDVEQLHGPGNSVWTHCGTGSELVQARRKRHEQTVRTSDVLKKVRHAKTRAERRRYVIQARNSGYSYTQIGIAARRTRQAIQQLIAYSNE